MATVAYQGKACHQSGGSYRLLELGFAKVEDMKFILLIRDVMSVSSSRRRVGREPPHSVQLLNCALFRSPRVGGIFICKGQINTKILTFLQFKVSIIH